MRLRLSLITAVIGLALCLTPVPHAYSQNLEGTVGLSGNNYSVTGNEAKFHEYTDKTETQILGNVDAKYDSKGFYLGFLARDPGYDTQHYRLEGGAYGKFKLFFDYNEIIHNTTFDARTFYDGVGSDRLTGTPSTNPDTWASSFDYKTKRKKFETGLKVDVVKPLFFNVTYLNEKKEGVRPEGVSTFGVANPSLELPRPVDYKTDGFLAEGGYAKNPFFLSFSYFYNEFKNRVQDLHFTNPFNGLNDILSQEPDSKFYKLSIKGSAKLPLNSKFSMKLGDARARSDADIFTNFDGKVDTRNADFQLASSPFRFVDGKIFYKYYERDNRSSGQLLAGQILSTATLTGTNPVFYKTDTYGADLGFRLPVHLYLNAGYKYVATDRRISNIAVFTSQPAAAAALVLPYNTDNIYFADLKYTGLDFMSARVGYERLGRGADYRTEESRNRLNRLFAYAAQDRDTFKAAVDLYPVDDLNLSVEYRFKRTNYNDTAVGFTDDTRNAVSFNADYALKKIARLYGYFDYERARLDQTGLVNASLWESKQREDTYGYGVRADLYAVPGKLTFIVQGDYLRANGSNDFGFFDNAIWGNISVPVGAPVDIAAWDDYQKYSAQFTAVYNWSPAITLRAGYAYARYDYSDSQLNNYQYVAGGGTGSNGAFLTGAYSRPSYSANIVFLGLSYRFQ